MATKYFRKIADGGIQMPTSKYYKNMTVEEDLTVKGNFTVGGEFDVGGITFSGSSVTSADGKLNVQGYWDARIMDGQDFSSYKEGDIIKTDDSVYFYFIDSTPTKVKMVVNYKTEDVLSKDNIDTYYGYFDARKWKGEWEITYLNTIQSYGVYSTPVFNMIKSPETMNSIVTKVETKVGTDKLAFICPYVDNGSKHIMFYDKSSKDWVELNTVTPDSSLSIVVLEAGFDTRSGQVEVNTDGATSVNYDFSTKASYSYYINDENDINSYLRLEENSEELIKYSTDIEQLMADFPCVRAYDSVSDLPTEPGSGYNYYGLVKEGATVSYYGWILSSSSWQKMEGLYTTTDARIFCDLQPTFKADTPKKTSSTVPSLPAESATGTYVYTATVGSDGSIKYAWVKQ